LRTLLVVLRQRFKIQGDFSLLDEEDVMVPNVRGAGLETPGTAPASDRDGPRSILQLVLGGFAGTAAFVLILSFLEPGLLIRSSGPARPLGAALSTPQNLGLIVFHFFNGSLIFPIAFGFFVVQSRAPWLAKGLIWGTILWLLAGVVVLPIAGFGFFGYAADGLRAAASGLAAHLAYGGLQGFIAGIPPRRTD
jgi:hypothetical protein